jgi:tRNA 2-thiouridine synthesizing protein A
MSEPSRSGTERLDARGLYCPVPILRARDRLKAMPDGAVLEVVADDPVILRDLPAFCRSHGHVYLGHEEGLGGELRLRLRKAGRDHAG